MGNIVLDDNKVTFNVLPNLSSAKNTIQEAYNACKSLSNSLPGSFPERGMVSNLAIKISFAGKDIDDAKQKVTLKMEYVKRIESKSEAKASSLSSVASKIGTSLGAVTGAVMGTSGGIVGATVGATAGAIAGKTAGTIIGKIADTGSKVVKSVVSGVKKVATSVGNAIKDTGSKIANGIKSIWQKASEKAKNVTSWVSDKIGKAASWTGKTLKNTGAAIASATKTAVSWLADIGKTVFTHAKRIGASIVNSIVSLTKGLIKLVEALGDLIVLISAGTTTLYTSIADIAKGFVTGKWEWSTTKKLWDNTKAVVAYDVTNNKIFKPFYSTKVGQLLDEYAYSSFKSTGMGCKIIEGVGYTAGVIAISCVTFGAGGVALAAPTTATMVATATAAGVGKYTEEEWNKNNISFKYGDNDLVLDINYNEYSEIKKLNDGESTTISKCFIDENGNPSEIKFIICKKENEYQVLDSAGNISRVNQLNESNTTKGLLVGGIKGAWEGAQYFVGAKIGTSNFSKITSSINSPIAKELTKSSMRIGLDMLTGAAEVPFQSAVTMISDNKNWNEAWEASGGWNTVKTQVGISGLMSFAGEIGSVKSAMKDLKQSFDLKTKEVGTLDLDTEMITPVDQSVIKTTDSVNFVPDTKKKIAGTDVEISYAYDKYLEPYVGTVYRKYGVTDIPSELVIDNLETIKGYNGTLLADKLDTIRMETGEFSPQAVTAESTAMQSIADMRGLNSDVRVAPEEVAASIDEMLQLTNSSKYRQFKNLQDLDAYFSSDLDYWEKALASSESSPDRIVSDSMRKYTGIYFDDINPYMRGQKQVIDSSLEDGIGHLSTKLDEFVLKDDIILYRGVDDLDFVLKDYGMKVEGSLADRLKQLTGGTIIIKDNAFMSATPIMGKGFTYKEVVEVIKAPAGTKGSFVGKYSTINTEVEFLLQAGEGNRKVIEAVEEIGNQIFVYTTILPK